ncbi:glycoside hydrolase family 15 protein [Legionella sp. km772]|uniref:glycoside hydrolase family 15 protein n=1 Tax=Legionella sp. km772 TaxID=2498111 RepID=UPI000F8DCBEC|nr:glycoside hydrolase family 15 protein [Legionella sp. km772]RUR11654.1 glucoamylase [Legionella sp. km772]
MCFIASQAFAFVFSTEEIQRLQENFFANIQSSGAIIASPSDKRPNYYFDWVRDSAIAMNLIETWYETSSSAKEKDSYQHYLKTYIAWTERIQQQSDPLPGQDILGEPKFYLSGLPFEAPWGRPQNDGPALRALVLIRFSNELLVNKQDIAYIKTHLYNASMEPSRMGVIKRDLEYVAHHWQEPNFDLWEEVYGHHFFTIMAQQKALIEGAELANRLDDKPAAIFYKKQAHLIQQRLYEHLDYENTLIQATLAPHPGPQKTLELDSSVILALLMHPHKEGVFSPADPFVQNTIKALHQQFNEMFPINNNAADAILFGRYPGDSYDGYSTNSVGNPWFILTATMAEYYYSLADSLLADTQNKGQALAYVQLGDNYLELIKHYAPDLKLGEQINLNTGEQQGAVSLTWSYVSVLRAIHLREQLKNKKGLAI